MSAADDALRSIIGQIESGRCATGFDYAYFAGQINLLAAYFSPDPQLLEEANKALTEAQPNRSTSEAQRPVMR